MTYTNTLERWMIWGLVGLLVISALPLNIAFAQTTPLEFTSGTSVSIVGSVVRVQWGYASGAPASNGTVQVYYNSQDPTVPLSTSAAHAATTSSVGLADIPLSSFTAGATYYFKVLAWDPTRGEATTAIKSLLIPEQSTQPLPPSMPTSVVVAKDTATSLKVSWGAPTGTETVSEYQLKYRSGTAFSITNWNDPCSYPLCYSYSIAATDRSYTLTSLTTGIQYFIGLRACASPTICSAVVSGAETPTAIVPSAPTTFSSSSVTADSVSFTVTPASDSGNQFRIMYKARAAGGSAYDFSTTTDWPSLAYQLFPTTAAAQPLKVTGLTAGTTYDFAVKIVTSTGVFSPYITTFATTAASTITQGTPLPVVTLTGPVTETTIPLSVAMPVNMGTGYLVSIRYKIGETFAEVTDWAAATPVPGGTALTTSQALTAIGLSKGTKYTFGIKATNTNGSAFTMQTFLTAGTSTPPGGTLPAGTAGLQGTVKNASGQPVQGATIGLALGLVYENRTTDANGYFSFLNIAAGAYTFGVGAPNYQPLTNNAATLISGQVTTVSGLVLVSNTPIGGGTAGLRVIVKDYAGAFVAGATVGLEKSGSPGTSGPTSSTGLVEFTNLAAGVYTFGVAPGVRTDLSPYTNAAVTLIENTTITRDVVLQKSGTTPPPGVIPGKPTGVSTSNFTSSSMSVSWILDSNVASYEIKKKEGKAFAVWSDVSDYARATTTPHVLSGLKSLTTYYVAIRACNSNNECSPYDEVSGVTTVSTPPPGQTQCSDGLDNDGDGSIDLQDFSCFGPDDNDEYYPQEQTQLPPIIQRLEPGYGPIGTQVRIYGSGFGATGNTVRLGSWTIGRFVADNGVITFLVPMYFDPCPAATPGGIVCMAMPMPTQPGTYPLTVSVGSGPASSAFQFSITSTTIPPGDQCLPSDNEADWFCVKKSDGHTLTAMNKCFLEKMRLFDQNLVILETGKRCANEPIPEPIQKPGIVKGKVIGRDAKTGQETGVRTTVYLRPQAATYTYGAAAIAGSIYSASTGDDGSFAFTSVRPGGYVLSAELPLAGFTREQEAYPLVVAASESTIQNIVFTRMSIIPPIPGKGGIVTGRVSDYTGKAIGGLDVWLGPMDFSATFVPSQRTNDQGIYLFPAVAPGKYRLGFAIPPLRSDLADPLPMDLSIAAGVTLKKDFTFAERREQGIGLPSGDASVKGTVKANDAPLAGATVQLKRRDGTGVGYMHTDVFGMYVFSNIAVAEYHMSVFPPPLQAHFAPIEEDIVLPAGGNYRDFTLTPRDGIPPTPIEKGTATIRGRVLYRDALADYPMKTTVFLTQYSRGPSAMQSQTTTEDGAFVFTNLPAGTYDLSAGLPSHAAAQAAMARDLEFYKITVGATDDKTQDIIFKRGRVIPPPLPTEDIEQRYQEFKKVLTDRQQMLANQIKDLQKKGSATHELAALQEQLKQLLQEAQRALRSKNAEELNVLFPQLHAFDEIMRQTVERLFRAAGTGEFIGRVKAYLAEAPKYIAEMQKAIDTRAARGEDVTSFESKIAEVERLREEGQALFDAGRIERTGDERGAGDYAFAMLDRGQQLYCDLGLGGGNCAVTLTGPVKTPAYIRTTLGKTADAQYKNFVKGVAVDSSGQFALEQVLPNLSPEQMRAMFAAYKASPDALRSVVGNLENYSADVRSQMLETNVNVHTEVQGLRETRDALDEVAGISLAARQTIDVMRKQLEKFVFPEGVGELVHAQLDVFNSTITDGAIKSPKTLEAYVRTFNTTINTYLQQARQEKFEDGLIPAKNIDEQHPIFSAALALREQGALNVFLNKKGEVPLGQKVTGKIFVRFFETAVDDTDAVAGATEKRLLKAKTVTGQDVALLIVGAHDLELTSRIRQNRAQFAAFMTRELGVRVTPAQLQQPVTTSQAIAWVGAAEEKFGAEEEALEEVTQ
ncbi:carboxypeptidase regulatory-like domain-containing protein [Candidatus Uhrbacteria bacterium]|nr:carboxypeptidase regulatory-like domain-containing protein [Candidatus Uhrbacteria bacterium]